LLYLTIKHVFENFGGRAIARLRTRQKMNIIFVTRRVVTGCYLLSTFTMLGTHTNPRKMFVLHAVCYVSAASREGRAISAVCGHNSWNCYRTNGFARLRAVFPYREWITV